MPTLLEIVTFYDKMKVIFGFSIPKNIKITQNYQNSYKTLFRDLSNYVLSYCMNEESIEQINKVEFLKIITWTYFVYVNTKINLYIF